MNRVEELFHCKKPMIAMLHLKGEGDEDVFLRAVRELSIYEEAGVDGVIVENYFGNYYQMERVLSYLKESQRNLIYGVNCLNHDAMGFYLAREYDAKFIQLDSVVGHVKPRDEASMEAFLNLERSRNPIVVLGGVRFKYQPVLSKNSVEVDLEIAKGRCDAVVVTGAGTGETTDIEKIRQFREILKEFPLIVGAGITPEHLKEQLDYCDGAIVGSYLKEGHRDTGEVKREYVVEMVEAFRTYRKERGYD